MRTTNKQYGFVLSLYEYAETISTIWDSVLQFMSTYPQHIPEDDSLSFVSDDQGLTYNRCHFVSISLCWVL